MVDKVSPPARAESQSVRRRAIWYAPAQISRVVIVTVALLLFGSTAGVASSDESTPASEPSTTPESSTTQAPPSTATPSGNSGGATEEERERVDAAKAKNAKELDVADADLSEVTAALATLQEKIEAQKIEVEIAKKRVTQAQAVVEGMQAELTEFEAEVAVLEAGVEQQALQAFKDVDLGPTVFVSQDPNRAIRMDNLLAKATRSDIDFVATLAAANEDLKDRRIRAGIAVEAAAELQREQERRLATLRDDQDAQARVAADAERRLDHLLAERAAIAALGEELEPDPATAPGADTDPATDTSAEDDLVDELNKVPPPPPPEEDPAPPAQVGNADMREAGKGIVVHSDIVDDVRRLLSAADAAGVDLAGGGYRDPEAQIATRRNNCGTSNYAIYEMPASQCSPPTARPGTSMHEQGKAIDFTYNGSLIRSRSGAGWEWLRANADQYGLCNLPSEPWHWSTNCR